MFAAEQFIEKLRFKKKISAAKADPLSKIAVRMPCNSLTAYVLFLPFFARRMTHAIPQPYSQEKGG